jgi:hypothetical protein
MRDIAFNDLDATFRKNFLEAYGFTSADWDKIRAAEPFDAGNGAKYLDPSKIEGPLSERLLMAIKEQGSYAFHQPDARTQAVMGGAAVRGTLPGELWLSVGQYKQFALERMTTHLMRVLVDGPIENRVARGIAFTLLSMAAGAVSIQAAAVISGKDPLAMNDPKFWVSAFARGGAGGVYGDVLSAALEGNRSGTEIAAQLAGPIPGLIGDVSKLTTSPLRREIEDQSSGRTSKQTFAHEAFGIVKRWTPNTWYTKLAVDRLLWDKLQVLTDPNYRQSFSRAEQNVKKQGSSFWWPQGSTGPARTPNLGTAIGRQ